MAELDDLDVTWRFGLTVFSREPSQQAPAAGDAGDGTAKTPGLSQGGAVDAPLTTAERVDSDPDPNAASIPGTGQGYGEGHPLSGRTVRFMGTTLCDSTGLDPESESTPRGYIQPTAYQAQA